MKRTIRPTPDIYKHPGIILAFSRKEGTMRFSVALSTVFLVVGSVLFLNSKFAGASAYSFVQSSWTGGATATSAVHPGNQTGWTQYSSATSTTAAANVTLTSTNYAFTDDGATSTTPVSAIAIGGGFGSGTNSSTTISGSGSGASVGFVAVSSAGAKTDYAVGPSPFGVLFDNVTNSIWVANNGSNTVTKLNATTGAVVGTYTVGIGPSRLSFDTVTNSIWVTNSGSNNISKINVNTGAIVGTYAVGLGPQDITFDSLTNSVWVANLGFGANTVSKVDINTGTKNDYVINGPIGITFDSFTGSVWVTDSTVSNNLIKLNATTGAVLGTYTVGTSGVGGVVFDSITNSVWVTDANNNTVIKVNVSTGAIVGTYVVGISPNYPAFDDLNSSIWTPNVADNTISQIDINTGAVLNTYIVGTSPGNLIFDSFTDSMWVSSGFDNIVSKVSVAPSYAPSGTFTSGIIDLGSFASLSTLSWNETKPTNTNITMEVQGSIDNITWSGWTAVTNGGSISTLNGDRYIQYRATLTTTDTAVTPTLNDVTINYSQYQSSGTLTSSVFDSGSISNTITKLAWASTGDSATEETDFQIRSSPDGITWSGWCGPALTCDGNSYFLPVDNNVAITAGHPLITGDNDRYFQYRAYMYSGGYLTPTLTSVTTSYDTGSVVAPPVISNVVSSVITSSGATITWDTDTASDSYVNYSTSPSLASPTNTGNATLVTTPHTVVLTGLTASTPYYFEVLSTDASSQLTTDTNGGTYYTFTTADSVPSGGGGSFSVGPTTLSSAASSITSVSAILNGTVNSNGITGTTRWFEWGTSVDSLINQTAHMPHTDIPAGSTATLSWSGITGATVCKLNGGQYVNKVVPCAGGSITTDVLTTNTTYTITASNGFGPDVTKSLSVVLP